MATGPDVVISDTKANILAKTPKLGTIAFATDTVEFYLADGTNWRKVPFALVPEPQNPDMGQIQDSSKIGYGTTYITDKSLNNVTIGSNGTASNGGIRVTTAGVFQVNLNGTWYDIDVRFTFRFDSTLNGYVFEHQASGFTYYLDTMTGQSTTNLGSNGYPIMNAYKTSMGAVPSPCLIGGRVIS